MTVSEEVAPRGRDMMHSRERGGSFDAGLTGGVPRGTETILLAEDDASVRAATRRGLERLGYTVLEAASGRAAIDLTVVHRGEIHLLFSDIVMPDMGASEMADFVRILRPGMRALFMSGYSDDVLERHTRSLAGAAFIPKPFTFAELAHALREVLDRR